MGGESGPMSEEHPHLDKRLLAKGELPTPAIPGSCALIQTVATALLLCSRPGDGLGTRSEGGVEICEIHCQHIEVLRLPHVQIIEKKLASRLQRNKRPPNAIELGGYA